MKQACVVLATGNILAALLFCLLAYLVPSFSELSTRSAFTELDRAGVINAGALNPNDPRFRFSAVANLDYRRSVPIYIARAPLKEQRFNAELGLLVCCVNAIGFIACAWITGRTVRKDLIVSEPPASA